MKIPSGPIWLQLTTVILGMSVFAAFLIGELLRQQETDFLQESLRSQSRVTSRQFSNTLSEIMRKADYSKIGNVVSQDTEEVVFAHSVRLQDAKGQNLAYWLNPKSSDHRSVIYVTESVQLAQGNSVKLRIGWQAAQRLALIESHVERLRATVFGAVLALGLSLVVFAHYIVVRPVESINRRILRLSSGSANDIEPPASDSVQAMSARPLGALPWTSAAELRRLNGAVDELSNYQTALIETQDSLKRARDEAQAANVAKSQFLAKMSHEIRTPINGVIGNLDLLSANQLDAETRSLVSNAQRAAHVLLTLLNQVLDFTRLEAGKLELEHIAFSMETLVDDVAQTLSGLVDHTQVALLVDLYPGLPERAIGDPTRIRQVMLNLLGNAVKFTRDGYIRVSVMPVEQSIRIEVRDTGPGIADEHQAKLFQAFIQEDSSTTRQFGGTGLGLSIARELVELMHGEIGFESTLGQGSNFWAQIPLEYAGPPSVLSTNLFDGKGALLITPEPAVGEVIGRYLGEFGLTARVERTLKAARLSRSGPRPRVASNGKDVDVEIIVVDSTADVTAAQVDRLGTDIPSVWLVPPGARVDLAGVGDHACTVLKPVRRAALRKGISRMLTDDPGVDSLVNMEPIPTSRDRQVLVVDDNLDNRMVACAMLKRLGIASDEARSGLEAIELVREKDYDVVLMDEQMPAMDGLEATREIRRYEQERSCDPVPIIALTASALEGDEQRCLDAGMDAYLAKPIRRRTLGRALAAWMPELDPE